MHPTTQKVVDAAHHLGLAIEIKEFQSGTRTAEEAAHAVGCMVGQIVNPYFLSWALNPLWHWSAAAIG